MAERSAISRAIKRTGVATMVLLVTNILWYLVVESGTGRTATGLVRAGALVGGLVQQGQLFRLLSSMFVHVTPTHLLVNMISLWTLAIVEQILGRSIFLSIYVVSGVVGNLFSLLFMPSMAVSAGASGAIFGLFGAMLALALLRVLPAIVRNQLLIVLLINVVLDVTNHGIDWLAHLGGLLAGLGLTFLYVKKWQSKRGWKWLAVVSVVVTAICLVIAVLTPISTGT